MIVVSSATGRHLTAAQWRVLRFLATYGQWHALRTLFRTNLLTSDDAMVLPLLIAMKLVEERKGAHLVRITAAGSVIVEENP